MPIGDPTADMTCREFLEAELAERWGSGDHPRWLEPRVPVLVGDTGDLEVAGHQIRGWVVAIDAETTTVRFRRRVHGQTGKQPVAGELVSVPYEACKFFAMRGVVPSRNIDNSE